ncbi:MAG: ABC transporter permease [Bacteroidales bacterium]|nr:MAG: ABC transporter permease [Bacteroidales bacterium]
MIRYFFKLAIRNIQKYRVNSIINLLGLSVGFAAFILIANVVRFELSYDRYHEKSDRIYRVDVDIKLSKETEYWSSSPYQMGAKLKSEYPEIENYFRECGLMLGVFKYKDLDFFENTGIYADNSIFEVLTIPFILGSPREALSDIYSIVLTEKFAKKYFGDKNPIGESLIIDNKFNYTVTGVIADFPENSSIRPDYIGSIQSYVKDLRQAQNWGSHFVRTYILLKEGVDYKEFNAKIKGFLNQFDDENPRYLRFNPLIKIHTNPSKDHNIWNIILLFGATAILILLIASLNFITLTNANLVTRIKEIKVQKILGGTKRSISLQHIGESVLITFISFDLGLFIAERTFVPFCMALNRTIELSYFLDIKFMALLFAIIMLIGFVSGIISVSKIINLKPLMVLGDSDNMQSRIRYSKRIPVIIQFFISIVLIVATIVSYKQMNYLKNKDLGFEKDNIICCSIGNINDQKEKLELFKQELLRNSNIEAACYANTVPYLNNIVNAYKKSADADDNLYNFYYCNTDPDYLNTYKIQLIRGESFTQNQVIQNQRVCLINETAQKMLGWENAVGRQLEPTDGGTKLTIIGIIKDYHIYSIQYKIPALCVELSRANSTRRHDFIMVRTKSGGLIEGKKYATGKLNEFFPDVPYAFFAFGNGLNTEAISSAEGIGRVLSFFSTIAIIIACMGVFGLVAITVKQKTKEIGIRKVLGASVSKIFGMISREFLILLAMANILAIPVALYVLDFFLQNFAYKTTVQITDFVIAIVLSIIFTLLAISYHAIKAARTNPVDAIKRE